MHFRGPAAKASGPFCCPDANSERVRPAPMDIRFADASDLPALTALINKAFKVEAFFIVRDRLTLEEAQALFEKGRFLLADEGGAVAGVVYVELRGDRSYLG